jgi:hypothetical protein
VLCKHVLIQDDPDQDKPATILRCSKHGQKGRGKWMFCIDAREEKCGLEAKDWEPQ